MSAARTKRTLHSAIKREMVSPVLKCFLKSAIVAIAMIAASSCSELQPNSPYEGPNALRQWEGKLRFPSNALEPDNPGYWLNANRYSSYILYGMNEPALFDQIVAEDRWTIRLTMLPSFSSALTGRIQATGDTAELTYKVGNSGGWGPVTAFDLKRAELSNAAMAEVISLIESSMICSRGYSERSGFDGTRWILEYKDSDQYCAYREWSPNGGFFHEIFRLIHSAIGMSREDIEELLAYY